MAMLLTVGLCTGLLPGKIMAADGDEVHWQLSIEALSGNTAEKNTADLWLGQPADFMVVSLAPPASGLTLEVSDPGDFTVIQRPPVPINRGGVEGAGYPVRLTAMKSGDLQLPRFSLSHGDDRKTVTSSVEVKAPRKSDAMTFSVERSADRIYLGQSIRLQVKWVSSLPLQALKAVSIMIPEMEKPWIRTLQPAIGITSDSPDSIGLPVGGRRVMAQWESRADGAVSLNFETIIQPRKAGEFRFSAPMILTSVDGEMLEFSPGQFRGMPYPAHFDNNFFDADDFDVGDSPVRKSERLMAMAKPFTLRVDALPEGAPEHFSGVVGRPDIRVTVSPDDVHQGEPVQVSFEITHPDLEVFPVPDLQQQATFGHSFDVPGKPGPARYKEENETLAKQANQSIFPRQADVSSVPPLVINYFDPESGLYRDYVTEPLPINVRASEPFSLSNSELSADVTLKNPVQLDEEGIWEHVWGEKLLTRSGDSVSGFAWWVLFAGVPPLLVIVALLPSIKKRLRANRQRRALIQFQLQLKDGGDPYQLLGHYLYRRVGLPPSQLSAVGLQQTLAARRAPSHLTEFFCQWIALYQRSISTGENALDSATRDELLVRVRELDRWLGKPETEANAEGVKTGVEL